MRKRDGRGKGEGEREEGQGRGEVKRDRGPSSSFKKKKTHSGHEAQGMVLKVWTSGLVLSLQLASSHFGTNGEGVIRGGDSTVRYRYTASFLLFVFWSLLIFVFVLDLSMISASSLRPAIALSYRARNSTFHISIHKPNPNPLISFHTRCIPEKK